LTLGFTKLDGGDPQDPVNQDRITNSVWLTRGFAQGLINAASSADCDPNFGCSYTHNASPANTQWATALVFGNTTQGIVATNYQNLAFSDWETAYGGRGNVGHTIVNRDAVARLCTQNCGPAPSASDIYLDLRFTDWTEVGSGGGFSYLRAVAPAQTTGDYNHNGTVDAADYVLWRQTLNQSASPAGSGADGSGNGSIDAADYNFWRARFGNVVSGSGSSASFVPEPSTVVLQLVFFSILCLRRKLR
jgi:hypothetical protein